MTDTPLSLRVAGSTSNLGPGFDCLGLCVSLFLDVSCELTHDAATRVERRGEPVEVSAEQDLLVLAFQRGRALAGAEPATARFLVDSEIPFGRGFGSSGAAVAAGLVLGVRSAGVDERVLGHRLLTAGLALEGHPDNVVASLRGGCTLGVPLASGGLEVLDIEVAPTIGWAVAWPATPLPTPVARRALPTHVSLEDAVENPRRLALLLEGLRRGAPHLLTEGVQDRLHERYRLPLIPGAAEALAAGRAAGAYAVTLSGAGSGLIALAPPHRVEAVVAALVSHLGPGATGRPVSCVPHGAARRDS
ncbi:MAG: homoserine kinase [Planctomycetota bacterium]